MMRKKDIGKFIVMAVFFVIVVMSAYTCVVMLLWNWLIPDIFGGNEITFWQSLGIIALVKILFISGGGGSWKNKKKHFWKKKMQKKWDSMDPDAKARMKEKFMQKCGSWYSEEKKESASTTEVKPANENQSDDDQNPSAPQV